MGRGKRDTNPVFLKIGLALAFSLGGMLYTFIRNKRIKPSESRSGPSKSSDGDSQEISGSRSKNDHHGSHNTPNSCQFDPLATNKHEELHNSMHDKDAYLLPEFNDLVKEFDLISLKTNSELPISDADSPSKVNSLVKIDSHQQEIERLKNMVKILKERERNLEVQLLEYSGLKEQQTAVMELQNRLKLNNMEAKVFALKIESLETDNKRLKSQLADYNKALADLEDARVKIKVLKKKLRSETAQNKERILDLQQRVGKMQEDEKHKGRVGIDPEMELKFCKLKDLEVEVNELRKSNYNLQVEKSELTQRLEHVQMLATSLLEDKETEKLKKESERLKRQNEDLTQEIEQLQADRCSDVEELVYLRWINACLRYELRNYQPGPGKTIARDLSKTLSPKSEEKAKNLILEYANKEGEDKTGIYIPELDSDQWSSHQSSNLTDSGELDESFIDYSSSRKSNHKFFGKLLKFLRGKDNHSPDHNHHCRHHRSHSRNSSFEQTGSVAEDMNSFSDNSFRYFGNSSKRSMDSQRSIHRHSDVGIHKRIDSIAEGVDIGGGGPGSGGAYLDSPSSSDGQKTELVKYAEVFKDLNPKPPTKYRRRSTPFSSF